MNYIKIKSPLLKNVIAFFFTFIESVTFSKLHCIIQWIISHVNFEFNMRSVRISRNVGYYRLHGESF